MTPGALAPALLLLACALSCGGGDDDTPTAAPQGGSSGSAGAVAGAGGAAAGSAGSAGAGSAGSAGAGVAGSAGAGVAGSSGAGVAGGAGTAGSGSVPGPGRLRVAAANLTSGTKQSWDPGEGARILTGLDLDVVLAQELNVGGNTEQELEAFARQILGPTATAAREPSVGLPNGVLSRYPILEHGSWDDPETTNRELAWARVDVPGDRDLLAVSVHLLTSSATKRDLEAKTLAARLGQLSGEPFVVVAGDFNTTSRDEPCIATLGAVLSVSGPYPADAAGNDHTNANRTKPYDWVLPSAALRAFEVPVVLGGQVFTSGLVFDSRVFTPLSAVAPAQANDSGADGMQHMAVVREFYLP